jgi:hypothetical protein
LIGNYVFGPNDVVAIEAQGSVLLGGGVRIVHTKPEYPRGIVFSPIGSSRALVDRIREAGFVPTAPAVAMPLRRGIPVHWWVLLTATVLWNALLLLDRAVSGHSRQGLGPLGLLALGLLFAGCLAIRRSAPVQALILKPGRSVGELKPILTLLQVISGLLLVIAIISGGAG